MSHETGWMSVTDCVLGAINRIALACAGDPYCVGCLAMLGIHHADSSCSLFRRVGIILSFFMLCADSSLLVPMSLARSNYPPQHGQSLRSVRHQYGCLLPQFKVESLACCIIDFYSASGCLHCFSGHSSRWSTIPLPRLVDLHTI